MKREIKFKAFSKESKKTMTWEDIKKFGNLSKLISLNHIELSQYIGLNDKNGVEIYENDLFAYSEHKGYSFESFTGEIKYQDGCFGFKVITGQNYQDFTPFSEIDELQHDFLNHVVVLV